MIPHPLTVLARAEFVNSDQLFYTIVHSEGEHEIINRRKHTYIRNYVLFSHEDVPQYELRRIWFPILSRFRQEQNYNVYFVTANVGIPREKPSGYDFNREASWLFLVLVRNMKKCQRPSAVEAARNWVLSDDSVLAGAFVMPPPDRSGGGGLASNDTELAAHGTEELSGTVWVWRPTLWSNFSNKKNR